MTLNMAISRKTHNLSLKCAQGPANDAKFMAISRKTHSLSLKCAQGPANDAKFMAISRKTHSLSFLSCAVQSTQVPCPPYVPCHLELPFESNAV